MKAILDTHIFLWWNMDAPQISPLARQFISSGENELFFSAASAWEIAIKYNKGRLVLPAEPGEYVSSRMAAQFIQPLPVLVSHALHVSTLPDIHQNPFDRLIIAQSMLEDLPVITADPLIAQYAVTVIW